MQQCNGYPFRGIIAAAQRYKNVVDNMLLKHLRQGGNDQH